MRLSGRTGYVVVAFFAVLVGLYPAIYFIIDRTFGLLSTKSGGVLHNVLWNAAFYTHIISGGIALLIGWIQFSEKFRERNIKAHRTIGKIYVSTVVLSAIAGIHIGFYATGGVVSALGFISLGLIWFYTTVKGYVYIRRGEVVMHEKMMIFSYAATFAAVTLRIWLPLLTLIAGDFIVAYTIVAWLCWVPNIVVGYVLTRKMRQLPSNSE